MKKFVIERILPGAGNLTPEELQPISQTSCEVVSQLGKPYHWIQSFIAEDKIYCIHEAESEDVIREHSSCAHFPITVIDEVKNVISPSTAE